MAISVNRLVPCDCRKRLMKAEQSRFENRKTRFALRFCLTLVNARQDVIDICDDTGIGLFGEKMMKWMLLPLAAALVIAAAEAPVVVHSVMAGVAAPQAEVLWDVGNRGMDDDGKPDASKLSPADWDKLAVAAQAMKDGATSLATAQKVIIVSPGTKLKDEGAPGSSTPQQMQATIDANPKAFATHAQALADVSAEFLLAAKTKDAAKLFEASGKLDQVCEACHMQFWYPEQK